MWDDDNHIRKFQKNLSSDEVGRMKKQHKRTKWLEYYTKEAPISHKALFEVKVAAASGGA